MRGKKRKSIYENMKKEDNKSSRFLQKAGRARWKCSLLFYGAPAYIAILYFIICRILPGYGLLEKTPSEYYTLMYSTVFVYLIVVLYLIKNASIKCPSCGKGIWYQPLTPLYFASCKKCGETINAQNYNDKLNKINKYIKASKLRYSILFFTAPIIIALLFYVIRILMIKTGMMDKIVFDTDIMLFSVLTVSSVVFSYRVFHSSIRCPECNTIIRRPPGMSLKKTICKKCGLEFGKIADPEKKLISGPDDSGTF